MGTSLTVDTHLEAIAARAGVMAGFATAIDLDTVVPTCPRWAMHDLIAHQGGVHRWATAQVRGEKDIDTKPMFVAPTDPAELAGWLVDGATTLVESLRAAPADLQAMRFLKDAPAPRAFWARRQAHETSIHSVDAQSAAYGGAIASDDAGISRDLAVDGLDELVNGFVPRGTSRLRHEEPFRLAIVPTDSDQRFTVDISSEAPVTRPGVDTEADVVVRGTALQLYLGLWNRGNELDVAGRAELLDLWRRKMRVRWS